jgi:hypothetical protein
MSCIAIYRLLRVGGGPIIGTHKSAQLDRATEQNASLVEEAAAALDEQAQRLRETAAVFRIA